MAFFVPFVLGAAAAAAGIHIFNNKNCCSGGKSECSCGCDDDCDCSPDCDCGCNSLKKKVTDKAEFALEKIKSGLQTLESSVDKISAEKISSGLQTVKSSLQTAENKVADFQKKLTDEKNEPQA